MRLTLHLLRHGSVAPETPWRFLGQRDLPLSPEGLAQAAAWRAPLKDLPFSRILCSDLTRCRGTAAELLRGSGRDAEATPVLREIDLGEWDGLSKAEVRARYPGLYEQRGADMAGFRPPAGESFQDLRERVLSALLPLLDTASGHVLVITHAGVIRVLLCHCLGMPLDNLFRLSPLPCRRTVIEWQEDTPRLAAFNLPPPGTPDQALQSP